jgi:hypothetical protein
MKSRAYLLLVRTMLGLVLTISPSLAQSVYTPYTFTTLSYARIFQSFPSGIAVDSANKLYMTDTNNTIWELQPAGTNWTVTILAGLAGDGYLNYGTNDGTGSAAQFKFPQGIAVDSATNIYVADTFNHTIRKISFMKPPIGPLEWMVTTLAGLGGSNGTNDGTGSAARFDYPTGIAVDKAGNLYVADSGNDTIRQVTPVGTNWMVTTLAGLADVSGTNDGMGSGARFNSPFGVVVDGAINLYVTDSGNDTIRKMTLIGTNWMVTTLAGTAGISGNADGMGSNALFYHPTSIAADGMTNIYITDSGNYIIRKIASSGVVTTLAGHPHDPLAFYDENGTGSAAGFEGLKGVTVDTNGNVYVADMFDFFIRKGYPENVPAVINSSGTGFGFTNSQFGFTLTAPAGQLVVVETSTDLLNWLPIWTNAFPGVGTAESSLVFSDPQSDVYSNRFYRARTP